MIKSSILASGSKGNAIYFESGGTSLLLDCGISLKQLELRLAEMGRESKDISAIVVSHEHTDHVKGVAVLASRRKIPVYITKKCRERVADFHDEKRKIDFHTFSCGSSFTVGDIRLESFPTPHDAVDPCGFVLRDRDGYSVGFATDIGYVSRLVSFNLSHTNHIMIEANHDVDLLMQGKYPWDVKQRIKSRQGHLSNEDCFALLKTLIHPELEHISLLHLSEENNNPDLLDAFARSLLTERRIPFYIGEQAKSSGFLLYDKGSNTPQESS